MKSYLSLLVVGLGVAWTCVGCDLGVSDGTGEPCEYAASKCPSSVDLSDLCAAGGCKVDDQPAACTGAWCSLGPKQRLVIPLAGAGSSDVRPNLDIHFDAAPETLEVTLDGQPISATTPGGPGFTIEWAKGPSGAKTLEISFGAGPSTEVSVEFHDTVCETNESLACEGGGA